MLSCFRPDLVGAELLVCLSGGLAGPILQAVCTKHKKLSDMVTASAIFMFFTSILRYVWGVRK